MDIMFVIGMFFVATGAIIFSNDISNIKNK